MGAGQANNAQCTHPKYVTTGRYLTSRSAPSRGYPDSYLIHVLQGSLDPRGSVHQTTSQSVQSFLHGPPVCQTHRHTNTETTLRATCVLCSHGRIRTAFGQCGQKYRSTSDVVVLSCHCSEAGDTTTESRAYTVSTSRCRADVHS